MRLKSETYKTVNGIDVRIMTNIYKSDTCETNMGTASECPSFKLGLCKVCRLVVDKKTKKTKKIRECYGLKSEAAYPKCVPYRKRQEIQWLNKPVADYVNAFDYLYEKYEVEWHRYNQVHDFKSQACVDKLNEIARLTPHTIHFGYTARTDLDFSGVNFIVRFSGKLDRSQGNGSTFVVNSISEAKAKASELGLSRNEWLVCGTKGTTKGKCAKGCKVCRKKEFKVVFIIKH